jgi:outer membrane receptor protein involved in Fe transport
MRNILLAVLSVCFALPALAQNKTGKISGTIQANDSKPLEAATVLLLRANDSAIVRTTITNKQGLFELDKVADGKYVVTVNAVGYINFTTTPIEVNAVSAIVKVQPISLSAVTKNLGDVTVTSKKPFIENKIDKMVVNVEASSTSTGLSALEILEKSPGITIDNDDNISVKGKQGVIILIDGKPSYLSGKDLANYLRNLPANQLDQVEIMTQPSAKYDASGNSGIINIKTKKSKANGFNGTYSGSAIFANYFKSTNNLTFNWRKNKFNLFGNYGYSTWVGFNDINISRAFRADANTPSNRYFDQATFGKFTGYPHNFKLGADFFASKNTTFGAVVTGNIDDRQFESSGVSNIYDSVHKFVQYNQSNSQTKDPWTNVGFNLNFRRILDTKGSEITADADYVLYRTKGNQYSDNYLYNPNGILVESPYLLKGYLPAKIDIYSFKADYTHPIAEGTKLEAGIKLSYVKTDNDAQYTKFDAVQNGWLIDNDRSNHFIYEENINAAYVNLNKQYKKLGVQLGLRAEQTVAKGDQVVKNSSFKRNYTQLFPTVYFSYKLNDNNTWGLSYGKRIERPGYQDLNPFQYLLDRYTYREGNPYLQPQFSHNIELSYNYKGQLNVSANYTSTTDIINDVLIAEKDGDNYITYQTKQNIATRKNIGLAINYNKQLQKWWSLNVFFNAYNNNYDGMINGENVKLGITAFSANLSNQFNFGKGWSGELSAFYNSKNLVSSVILAQPMGMFALGGGKQILQSKGSIRLNIRDPFWLMKFRGSTDMEKFTANIQSKWDNRRFIVSFTYRFGKTAQQQQRKRSTASQDEQSRVNTGQQQ